MRAAQRDQALRSLRINHMTSGKPEISPADIIPKARPLPGRPRR